jgi:diguanylate cyclase (GGDEF)-like protein/PAS domain S-box-containing protein
MSRQETVNFVIMLCVSVLMFTEAAVVWRRFRFPGGVAMCLALAVGGAESLCYALVFRFGQGVVMIHLAAIYSVTGPAMGAFWFLFAARFAGVRVLRSVWLGAVLVAGALVLVLAVGADPSLVYPPGSHLTAMSFAHINVRGSGGLFTVQLLWFYVLVISGMVLLMVEALRSWDLYRSQVEAVVAGIGITFLLDVAFMAGYTPVRGLHLGLVVLSVGMLPLIWALPRLRAADYSAVWQQRVLEGMSDAVLVADGDGRIVSANRVAQRLLTAESGRKQMAANLTDYPWLAALGAEGDEGGPAATGADTVGRTVTVAHEGGTRHFDLRRSSIYKRDGRELSSVIVLRDITERVETAEKLDKANDDLQILVDASLEFGASLNMADVLEVAARRMREVSGADSCDIYRLNGGRMQLLKVQHGEILADEGEDGSFMLADYSISRQAIETRQPICVSDIATDARLSASERRDAVRFGYGASIDLPLVSEGVVVGLAVLTSAEPREYGRLELLPGLAHNAAQALVNSQMFDELRQTAKRLALVGESSALFSSTLAVDDVLVSCCRRLCEIADAPICSVYVRDGEALRCRAGVLDGEVDEVWMAQSFSLSLWPTTRIALDSRGTVTVEDLDDPRLGAEQRASMSERGEISLLVVPLVAQGEAFGAVELVDRRPRRYGDDELATVEAVCSAAALAIRNADTFHREREHGARLASLLDASRAITSTVVLDRVLPIVAEKTCNAVGAGECVIWEYRKEQDLLVERTYYSSVGESYTPADRVALEHDDARRAVLEGNVLQEHISDARLQPAIRALMEEWHEKSRLSVPLLFDGHPIGMLVLIETERERHFKPDEVDLVQALAEQAAVVIQNARQYEQLESTGKLLESQVELRQVLLEVSGTLLASLEHEGVFARIATLVKRVVDNDCLEIRLVDTETEELYCAYASDADDHYIQTWRSTLDVGVSGWVVRHNEAQLVNDMPGDPRVAVVEGTEPEPQASIIVPLTVGGNVIGVLALDRMQGRTFAEHELESAKLFANLAAIAIQNAQQYQHVKTVYSNNLRALCTALNAKDHYTLGHTARVAAYMVLLGRELGWSAEVVGRVGEAAYLHDIGKIGIPDRVLTKAGKLNQREWEMMRQHPSLSAEIIRPLYEDDVVHGVRHHHERVDGRGYPDGLAGEQIPLIARAMCVVDSYDAMSFDRPYHRGLSYAKCLEELERCKGSQFDPAMVDAFVAVLRRIAAQRRRALAAGRRAAKLIDAAAHKALSTEGSEDDPAYAQTVEALRRVRDANPGVRYVTTLARRGEGFIFVCDAEEHETERSRLGDPVVADEELTRTLAGETLDVCLVSADQYGIWISAMTPVRDASGEIVAAVSVDYPAYDVAGADGLTGDDVTQTLTALLEGAQDRVDRVAADAITDTLTGLYNHRYLHEGLARELEQVGRDGGELSLVLFDVDHLERYNRQVGHPRGDDALRVIGQLVDYASRSGDLCARFGGDEFALVLNGRSGAEAFALVEDVRAAVAKAGLGFDGQALTLSAGVATYPWDAQDKETLLEAARGALALAKNRGRDRCVGFAAREEERPESPALDYLAMMADLADAKMLYQARHSETVAGLAGLLATELGLSGEVAAQIGEAARLRDIGHFAVPDEVLSKPGVLSAEEWALIREHPQAGARLLRRMGMDSVADAVAHHHERFDGTGYPASLSGEQIPIAARIVSVASAFEAMLSSRPYRAAHSTPDALEEMRRCTGTQFDPDVVGALERVMAGVVPGHEL